jgi:hypothetical protein
MNLRESLVSWKRDSKRDVAPELVVGLMRKNRLLDDGGMQEEEHAQLVRISNKCRRCIILSECYVGAAPLSQLMRNIRSATHRSSSIIGGLVRESLAFCM